jgi:thiol:disulfide interchange protein DsbA
MMRKGILPTALFFSASVLGLLAGNYKVTSTASATPAPRTLVQAGVGYQPIDPSLPARSEGERVEIIEIFSYDCHYCYELEPFVQRWARSKPAYVDFMQMHAAWHESSRTYARLYYTIEKLDRSDLHEKVFQAIHRDGNRLLGANSEATFGLQEAFAKTQNLNGRYFASAYTSAETNAAIKHSLAFSTACHTLGTPAFVVNGRHQLYMSEEHHEAELFASLDAIAAYEKKRRR